MLQDASKIVGETKMEESMEQLGAGADPDSSGGGQCALGIFWAMWGIPWIKKDATVQWCDVKPILVECACSASWC